MNTAERPRLFSHITRTRFLHIEDSLEQMASRPKIRFFIGAFERGHGATSTAYAFLDLDKARVILNDLAWGKPVEFVDFTGGKDGMNAVVARSLKIKTKEQQVWIQVANGPGQETAEGAIRWQGKPSAEISIQLTIFQARGLGFACLDYIHAWQTAVMLREFNRALPVGKQGHFGI